MQLQWELQDVTRVEEMPGTPGKGPGTSPVSDKGDRDLQHCLGVASPLQTLQNPNKQAEDPQKCKRHKEQEGNGCTDCVGAEGQGFLHWPRKHQLRLLQCDCTSIKFLKRTRHLQESWG